MGNVEAAEAADTLVLVVKPQDMGGLVEEIRDHVSPGNLVVSLAAGITTAFLESRLPQGVAVVRVMPNTPALVDQGMAAVSPGRSADADHLEVAPSCCARAGGSCRSRRSTRTPSPRSAGPGRPTSSTSSRR